MPLHRKKPENSKGKKINLRERARLQRERFAEHMEGTVIRAPLGPGRKDFRALYREQRLTRRIEPNPTKDDPDALHSSKHTISSLGKRRALRRRRGAAARQARKANR